MIVRLKAYEANDQEEVKRQYKTILSIEQYLIDINPPESYSNKEGALIRMDKSFENLCAHMEASGVKDPKSLSVYEFYSRVEFLEKKNNPKKSY